MRRLIVAKSGGFCFGVERAVKMANQALETGELCYCIGQLIHNDSVAKDLEARGLRTVASASGVPSGAKAIIRSHGISRGEYCLLSEKGVSIIDATCPKVKRIHEIVSKASSKGRIVVIIGSSEHPEVRAIQGWCGESIVFSNPDELINWALENDENRKKPLTVVFQTTQIKAKLQKYSKNLKNIYTNIEIFDTICSATSVRQEEAEKLSATCDLMVVIGSKHSANSVHLAEICKERCDKVCFVENADELPTDLIGSAKTIGITAGASAPAWIIKEVKQKMADENMMEDMTIIENQESADKCAAISEEAKTEAVELAGEEAVSETHQDMPSAETDLPPEAPSVENLTEENLQPETNSSEKSFAEMVEDSIKTISNGETVSGVVAAITATEISVDLGTKHSGYIPLSEFTDNPEAKIEDIIQIGSRIEACVVRVNDVEGTVMLSKKRLDAIKNWSDIEAAQAEGTIVEGIVTEENKGGVVVSVNGVRVFVPASQTGIPKNAPMSELLRQKVRLKITEVNKSRRRVVGSIRAVAYKERKERSEKIWNEIEIGKIYDGVVKSLTTYGAFVDIGGIDGMIHVSELSWSRVKQPSEVVAVGDEISVRVLGFDKETKKISLGYKDPQANPWVRFNNAYKTGDKLDVKVVKLMPFGAFAEVLPGVDGLIHISQITDRRIGKPDEILTVGEIVRVKVISIDDEKQKISLSIRALSEPDTEVRSGGRDESTSMPAAKEDALVYEISEDGRSAGNIPDADE